MKPRARPRHALALLLTLLGCGRSDLSVLSTTFDQPGFGGTGQAGTAQAGHAGSSPQAGAAGHAGSPLAGAAGQAAHAGSPPHAGAAGKAGSAGQAGAGGQLTSLTCEDDHLSYQGVLDSTPFGATTSVFGGGYLSSLDDWNFNLFGSPAFLNFSGHESLPDAGPTLVDLAFGRADVGDPTGSWFCGRGGQVSVPDYIKGQFSLPALTFLGACPGGEPVPGSLHVQQCFDCSPLDGSVDGVNLSSETAYYINNEQDVYGAHTVMQWGGDGRLYMSVLDGKAEGALLLPQGNPPVLTLYCLNSGTSTPGSEHEGFFSSISRLGVCPAANPNGSLEGCF